MVGGLLFLPYRACRRLYRWSLFLDCTCPGEKPPWADEDHVAGCPHPLFSKRPDPDAQDTDEFPPVQASLTIYTSQGAQKRRPKRSA